MASTSNDGHIVNILIKGRSVVQSEHVSLNYLLMFL